MIKGFKDPYRVRFKMPKWIEKECSMDDLDNIRTIIRTIRDHTGSIRLTNCGCWDDFCRLLHLALYIDPLTFDLDGIMDFRTDGCDCKISLSFLDVDHRSISNRVAELYYEMDIGSCRSDLDVELRVNDWLVENCEWNDEADLHERHSAIGILLHGKGVCSSFAHATTLLLNCFGVECYTVYGHLNGGRPKNCRYDYEEYFSSLIESATCIDDRNMNMLYACDIAPRIRDASSFHYPGHAWNYVVMNGRGRHLDVTFDCGIDGNPWFSAIHDYFNLTTSEIQKERTIHWNVI